MYKLCAIVLDEGVEYFVEQPRVSFCIIYDVHYEIAGLIELLPVVRRSRFIIFLE